MLHRGATLPEDITTRLPPVPKYRVRLNGANFLMNQDDKVCRLGFYTTRFVEAGTPEEAEKRAVQLVRDDGKLKAAVLNDKADPPMIYLEEIDELVSFDGIEPPGGGYTFFLEDGEA